MVNEIWTIYIPWLNKGFGSNFQVDSQIWHETPKESCWMHQPKHCEYNKEDNSQNILTDINYQASSQKFRQIMSFF